MHPFNYLVLMLLSYLFHRICYSLCDEVKLRHPRTAWWLMLFGSLAIFALFIFFFLFIYEINDVLQK